MKNKSYIGEVFDSLKQVESPIESLLYRLDVMSNPKYAHINFENRAIFGKRNALLVNSYMGKGIGNLDPNNGYVYLNYDYTVNILNNFKTKMTFNDFIKSVTEYNTPKIINDALYNYIEYPICVSQPRNTERKVRNLLAHIRNDVFSNINSQAINLQRGHNTELYLINELERLIGVDYLYMFPNIYIGDCEHDILMVCEKGVFTIEVKDHLSRMSWDENDNFIEEGYGMVYDNPTDPYKQTLYHEKCFNKAVNKDIARGVVLLGNEQAEFESCNPDIENRIFFAESLANKINELPVILDKESVEKIMEVIKKVRIYKNPKFLFTDVNAVDEWFMYMIDHFKLDVHKEYDEVKAADIFYDNKNFHQERQLTFILEDYKRIKEAIKETEKVRNPFNGMRYVILIVLCIVYIRFFSGLFKYDELIVYSIGFATFLRCFLGSLHFTFIKKKEIKKAEKILNDNIEIQKWVEYFKA